MPHRAALLLIATLLSCAVAHAADGLVAPDSQDLWPQWQARITVASSRLSPVSLMRATEAPLASGAAQIGALVGDFYFDAPGLRLPQSVGGLRATGGLMAGSRNLSWGLSAPVNTGSRFGLLLGSGLPAWAAEASSDTLPYLGLGYTGLSAKGRWGITADLGLVAEPNGGSGRPGRPILGIQSLDSALTSLRLSPVLQLGVSYSF